MFNDPAELRALFTRVLDQMLAAGWLHSHTFTDGKGHHLVWTPDGGERALALKRIAETFRLADDDRAPVAFDVLARGGRLPDLWRPIKLEAGVAAYWRDCVAAIGLHGDEDGLIVLLKIADGWAPDWQTPVKFGP